MVLLSCLTTSQKLWTVDILSQQRMYARGESDLHGFCPHFHVFIVHGDYLISMM